ncbi:MAG: photosynthetic complex assembly protein PuhC [Pseudomonadota bacterium]
MSQLSQQMKHRDKEMVPRVLVIAMFSLMAASLLLVAYAQWFDVPQRGVVNQLPIVNERQVVFESSREGVSTVYDLEGNQIAHSGDELQGFVGVIGIALRRERTINNADLTAPVTIAERNNGTIVIIDPETGWSVDLLGYGQDNVAAIAGLLN